MMETTSSTDATDYRARLATIAPTTPLLLYAGSCPKCRALARLTVLLSLHTVRKEPLEKPEWQKFYYEEYPQARGYPVLFLDGRPIFGRRVFLAVPRVILTCWVARLRRLAIRSRSAGPDAMGGQR
jgi:hypothetical protein